MANKAIVLKDFSPATLELGSIEPMYGGTGLKASIRPSSHVVLPALRVPWKIQAQRWGGQANPTAKLAVSIPEESKEVLEFVKGIETLAMQYIQSNRKKFFPGKKGANIPIPDLFNSALRGTDDFDPIFSAKLATNTNEETGEDSITTPCFDMQRKELVDPNIHLEKGAIVVAVVQPSHIYAINNSAGITWKTVRIGIEAYESEVPDSMAKDEFDFGM